jgi:hypothetical protein
VEWVGLVAFSFQFFTPLFNDPSVSFYFEATGARLLAARLPKKYRMFWPVLLDRPDYELMEEIG